MKVSRETIKSAFRNASKTFSKQWSSTYHFRNPAEVREMREQFWKDFSKAHNMNINIDEFKYNYPVINETIEFNTEQDYLMFILRWS